MWTLNVDGRLEMKKKKKKKKKQKKVLVLQVASATFSARVCVACLFSHDEYE